MKTRRHLGRWFGMGAAAAAVCSLAAAQPAAGMPDQRVWLRLGAFQADIDTRVRVDDADLGIAGTDFTFERYGMADKKTLPFALLGARLGERFRLEFEYFKLSRTGRGELDRDIVFQGTTFPVHATLESRFRSDVARASLGYSFIRTPQFELGAVGGAHVTRFDILLQAAATATGGGTSLRREEEDATVPLPTLGVYGSYSFGSGWAFSWRADLFSVKHGDYDGRLVNTQADVLYRFTPNVAVGASLRYLDYRLRSTGTDFRGEVNYKFKGPQVFLEAGF